MPDIRTALSSLVEQLSADGELSDEDLALIHDAAIAQAQAIQAAKHWAELAHIHEQPHRPVITTIPTEGLDEDQWPESVDASGLVCHDCGRELIADAGTVRILVCPTLHGRRPGTVVPADPDGAVECGRPAA